MFLKIAQFSRMSKASSQGANTTIISTLSSRIPGGHSGATGIFSAAVLKRMLCVSSAPTEIQDGPHHLSWVLLSEANRNCTAPTHISVLYRQ